jgi:hypothetical protein
MVSISPELVVRSAVHLVLFDSKMLWMRCGQLDVTQGMLVEASANFNPAVLEFLLWKEPTIIPATSCFTSPLVYEMSSSAQRLDLLLDRCQDFLLNDEIMCWLIEGSSGISAYFLNKLKSVSPTNETWKKAAIVSLD